MNINDVHELLQANQNERGIENWNKLTDTQLKSYGIGLTLLRKLAKKVGKDASLAKQLWRDAYYDARVISLLIDDPKTITREQAETQVEQLQGGYLAHVFSSCNATLAKASFLEEVIADWTSSEDDIRLRCGYGLLYEISKSKKKSAPKDEYFTEHLTIIEKKYSEASKQVLLAMGGAVHGIGVRNVNLHPKALKLAKKIGPIDFNGPDQNCEPFDVVKNLTSDYVVKKFNL